MKYYFGVGSVAMAALMMGTSVQAESEFQVEERLVNGYRVYLIDAPVGNAVRLEAFVPRGGFHDRPEVSGISHFIEHAFHDGSKRFPGMQSYREAMSRLGVSRNASTGFDQTRYYAEFHPEAFSAVTDRFADLLTDPLFPEAEINQEKGAVVQEIDSYRKGADWALFGGPFVHLLPDGHYLKKLPILGMPDQIEAITPEDLWQVFRSDYRPEQVRIAVAANFSEGSLQKEKVIETLSRTLQTNAHLSEESAGPSALELEFPPLIATPDAPRVLELGTDDESRKLLVIFEVPQRSDAVDRAALEMLLDYWRLDNSGSFLEELRSLGWISDFQPARTHNPNIRLMEFGFDLTEAGSENKDQVLEKLFTEIRRLQLYGLSDEELEFIKQLNLNSYREAFQDRGSQVKFFKDAVIHGTPHDQVFDIETYFGSVDNAAIKRVALDLYPENYLYTFLDPANEGELSDVFLRPFRTRALSREEQERAAAIFLKPDVKNRTVSLGKIDLEFGNESYAQVEGREQIVETDYFSSVYLREELGTKTGVIRAELEVPSFSLRDRAALALFVDAFRERYAAEISYLRSIKILEGLSIHDARLRVDVKGNTLANQQALLWIIEKLKNFEPTEEEIARSNQELQQAARDAEDKMSAIVAYRESSGLLRSTVYTFKEIAESAKELEREPIKAARFKLFSEMKLRMGLVGDYSMDQALDLETDILKALSFEVFSKFESPAQDLPILQSVNYWRESGQNKKDNDYGGALVLEGPKKGTKEDAAVRVVAKLLGQEVTQINREERKLGYVHTAMNRVGSERTQIVFAGGTMSLKDHNIMRKGWAEAVDNLREKLTPDVFTSIRSGLLNQRRTVPGDPVDRAARYLGGFFTNGDPGYFDELTHHLESLTFEEVKVAMERYFNLRRPQVYIELSKEPTCSGAVSDIFEARRRLAP